ncbi:MAG: twin-arginine translocation signal domain-containing protein [Pseudomonadota bacterium]|nr:twin-arginine translocation signal domain-containing protein [Pseudomonadota bacterium]
MTEIRKTIPRRNFIKAAGFVGATAGVAAIASKSKPVKANMPAGKTGSGYQETKHVKKYYELARF